MLIYSSRTTLEIADWNESKFPEISYNNPWSPPRPFLTTEQTALAEESYLQAIEKHSWELVPAIMHREEANKICRDLLNLTKITFLGYAIHPEPPVHYDYIFWPKASRYF